MGSQRVRHNLATQQQQHLSRKVFKSLDTVIFSVFTRAVMLCLQANSPLEVQYVGQTKLDLRQGSESAGLSQPLPDGVLRNSAEQRVSTGMSVETPGTTLCHFLK